MTQKDLIVYMAGFFDGEGYVGISTSNKKYDSLSLRVLIGQRDKKPLELAQKRWGGAIWNSVDSRNGRDHYRWDIKGQIATKFLSEIQPYLVVKKKQVKYALIFANINQRHGNYNMNRSELIARRYELKDRIKLLNSPMGFGKNKPQQINGGYYV